MKHFGSFGFSIRATVILLIRRRQVGDGESSGNNEGGRTQGAEGRGAEEGGQEGEGKPKKKEKKVGDLVDRAFFSTLCCSAAPINTFVHVLASHPGFYARSISTFSRRRFFRVFFPLMLYVIAAVLPLDIRCFHR